MFSLHKYKLIHKMAKDDLYTLIQKIHEFVDYDLNKSILLKYLNMNQQNSTLYKRNPKYFLHMKRRPVQTEL